MFTTIVSHIYYLLNSALTWYSCTEYVLSILFRALNLHFVLNENIYNLVM